MLRLRRMGIDTQSEHVVFIHANTVARGVLGLKPMDRIRVHGADRDSVEPREIAGIVNFCEGTLLDEDEIGLSNVAFADLGLPEGASVNVELTAPPRSVDKVRQKLRGETLSRSDFDAIIRDVCARRYSKPELSMFVLACALRHLDVDELIAFTGAMIDSGSSLHFDAPVVADKHCIGGIPGNRTTLIVVPILAALGMTVPKTSSKAITSAAGTADTMGALARVDLSARHLHDVVEKTGACIAWGGALELAPADDVLITVERPMQIDTESQMIASILAKKKTAGATHALIDIPLGPSAKIRSLEEAEHLTALFGRVARAIDLEVDVVTTDARGPIGNGIGPRLEALDVLSVLRGEAEAPQDLREKSLFLSARILERTGRVPDAGGYVAAKEALDSGRAERTFQSIVAAQGERALPPEAAFQTSIEARRDGRLRTVDCLGISRLAKLAGSPAHPAAGVVCLKKAGQVTRRGEPLLRLHAQSASQLRHAEDYANAELDRLFEYGY